MPASNAVIPDGYLSGPALGGPNFVPSRNPKAPGLWPKKTKTRLLAQIATERPHTTRAKSACQSRRTRQYVLTDILYLERSRAQPVWEMLAKAIVCGRGELNRKKSAVSNQIEAFVQKPSAAGGAGKRPPARKSA